MWYIHMMVYYSAIKREEILLHATTGMDPEDIMLREIIQSEEHILCDFIYMRCVKQSYSSEQNVEWWFPGAGRRGRWGLAVPWV